jgi:drug/metabolite transporter (DMT)-like permease
MQSNLRGILWTLLALPSFQLMNVMLRFVGEDLPPVQIMFLRTSFGFIVLLPWLIKGGRKALVTRQPGVNLIRACCHVGGMSMWVYALTQIPLATVGALAFTSPLFVAIGGVLFFGEPSRWSRWIAIAIGFAGTLIIIRPGAEGALSLGALAVLGAAVLLAISTMLTKKVTQTDNIWSVVFYLNLMMAAVSLVPAAVVWEPPSLNHYGWFVCLALMGAVAHFTRTSALAAAELTVLQPFEFIALIWAALLGYFLFNEVPGVWVFAGGGVIILAATLVVRSQRQTK